MDPVALTGWLEASALARAMRDGAWLYPLVNVAHVLGVATLFGAVAVLDLRLIGLWRQLPVARLAQATLSLAAIGLAVAAATGLMMLPVEASRYVVNPMLYVKFAAIALAGANAALLHRVPAWAAARRGEPGAGGPRLGVAAGVSLACWTVALAAGRLIAYW